MIDEGAYEYPVWCQMETALQQYEDDRQKVLEAQAKQAGLTENQLNEFNKAAESLIQGVQILSGIDCISLLIKLTSVTNYENKKWIELFQEQVFITFGWEVMEMLSKIKDRFMDLVMLLDNRNPCQKAEDFLQRVARCYLFGFDAECVVMCRAVLDQEFNNKITGDNHVTPWWQWYINTPEGNKRKDEKPPVGAVWAKIEAAAHFNVISETIKEAAHKVRDDGNNAVHRRPFTGNPLDNIKNTVEILDKIENRAIS